MRWPMRAQCSVAGRCVFVMALMIAAGTSSVPLRADPFSWRTTSGYDAEQRAAELYLDGVEKLAGGHPDYARQTFESVVARFPGTEAADSARQQLGDLDAREPVEARNADSFDAITVTGSLPALADMPAAGEQRAPAWDRELRRNASIQSKLRIEAGDRVFFSPGSAELGSRARSALDAQAHWLMRWHEFEAAIEGHADEPGSEQDNVALSQRRAEAVRQRLIEEGVEPSRIAIVPLGRSVRIATCADTDCRAQNRRAVTLVFATGTRERLGLLNTVPMATALSGAPVPTPTAAEAAALTATQTAGMTR